MIDGIYRPSAIAHRANRGNGAGWIDRLDLSGGAARVITSGIGTS
jgi:hypothetical protein